MAENSSKENRKVEEEKTVEQNLSAGYIPKSRLGDLPMNNQLDKDLVKQMDKTKADIEKLKKDLTKEFKFIEAIGIVPAQASQKIEEEYEVPEEDCKRKLIHLLVVIPEDKFKEIQKIRLECIKKAKDINDKIWVHVMTPVDIWNLGMDSKFDVVEALAMSYPILDKGLLGALRLSSIHKSMVLRKFEKYVTSYVIAGSLVRGDTKPTSDVDVFIVIDDTDVKRMPRFELKEKLRSVIFQYIQEATAIAGVKNPLNVQVYLMTEFWEAVKDAHPVMFTFIRDGIPLYDRGAFLPWKSLLKMGKIKPSPEAIDMFMSSGDKLEENVDRRMLDILVMDIFWGVSTPTQGLLMMYGLAPPTPKETVRLFREVFVEKEKLVEKKYADILEEIIIKYYKGYEHGDIKKISGIELQKVYTNALDYMKRLKELRGQIEKRMQDKSIQQVYNDVFSMIGSLLNKSGEAALIKAFDEQFVKQGKMPQRFLDGLKFVAKTKKDTEELNKDKKKKITGKEITAVEDARKMALEITNTLIEYVQRKDFVSMDRKRFVLKTADKMIEVFFLKNVYVVDNAKIFILKDKLVEVGLEELNKALAGSKEDAVKIIPEVIESLRKIYGDFELGY
jgi:predicted nucleotidyltransferase